MCYKTCMSDPLSRRERQIMDLVYRLARGASVSEIHQALADAPSYSAVRALMGTLVDKGHLVTARDGRRYLYSPTVPAEQASASALDRVVTNFFGGSKLQAALALVEDTALDPQELEALELAIAQAREEGR
ncbi:MAG: BlaI family penicillinase repressor [Cognaticolwellia sp.]|jgi:BlaI family penicillinase repressor